MKNCILLFYAISITLLCLYPPEAKTQTFKDPVSYLNFITEELSTRSKEQWDYTRAVAHSRSARKVEKRRKELLVITKQALSKIRRMPVYNKNSALRDTAAAYLSISYNVLNDDYSKIMDLEEIAERSYNDMEAYLLAEKEAGRKLNDAFQAVIEQRKNLCQGK